VNYDRPGRGESTGRPPYGLVGEVEALRALVTAVRPAAAPVEHRPAPYARRTRRKQNAASSADRPRNTPVSAHCSAQNRLAGR
jgi:hypothetical protein